MSREREEREGMARRKSWTHAKRRRARRKAEAALKERRRIIAETRERTDTSYAGMVPLAEYGDQILKLRERLPGVLGMKKGKTAVYQPEDEAMAYVGCQLAGIVRLNHIDQLLPEGVLAEALGIPQWMSENTQQRFLKRATEETLEGIDGLTGKIVEEEQLSRSEGRIEVDGDVTGIPQRGRQREGVESGYCGGRVRPCCQQPRVTVNGVVWWTDLRRGKDACLDLPGRTLGTASKLAQKYPKREVFSRLDGYWASKANLREAQEAAQKNKNLIYLMPIHASDMKEGRWEDLVAQGKSPWKRVNSTTEIRELGEIKPWGDEAEPVRAVAVRRKEVLPKGKQRRAGEKPQWDLRYLIVTGARRRRLGTRKVFKGYHQRQREEFSFKDGKQSLSTAKMPTMKLQANRMHVKLVGLAQAIFHLFAKRFLPHPGPYGPECKTIREKVIVVGGKNRAEQGGGVQTDVLCVPLAPALGGPGA